MELQETVSLEQLESDTIAKLHIDAMSATEYKKYINVTIKEMDDDQKKRYNRKAQKDSYDKKKKEKKLLTKAKSKSKHKQKKRSSPDGSIMPEVAVNDNAVPVESLAAGLSWNDFQRQYKGCRCASRPLALRRRRCRRRRRRH